MSETMFRIIVVVWTAIILTVTVLAATVFPSRIGLGLLAGMVAGYAIRQAVEFWREA